MRRGAVTLTGFSQKNQKYLNCTSLFFNNLRATIFLKMMKIGDFEINVTAPKKQSIGQIIARKTLINPFDEKNTRWPNSGVINHYRNLFQFIPQSIIISTYNAILSIVIHSKLIVLLPWFNGGYSQPKFH